MQYRDAVAAGGGVSTHRFADERAASVISRHHGKVEGDGMGGTIAARAVRSYLTDRSERGEISASTVRNQACVLYRFAATLGDRDVATIKLGDIERYLRTRAHITPNSRRVEIGTLHAFCRWMVKHKRLKRNPVEDVKRPRKPRSVPAALPHDAVRRLLDTCAEDARLNAVVWAMLGLGLRRAEVASLRIEDWDRRAQTLRVTGKGGHERLLPVTAQVEAAWVRYLRECPASSGPLFRSRKPPFGGLAATSVTWMVTEALKDAGLKSHAFDRVCAHALRHTALSDTLDACGDLRVVMEMAGHSSLAVTSIYQRRSQVGQLREAMSDRPY